MLFVYECLLLPGAVFSAKRKVDPTWPEIAVQKKPRPNPGGDEGKKQKKADLVIPEMASGGQVLNEVLYTCKRTR